MADRSFGVREINIVGSAGTPTISSPNNINLNGNNVAISTDLQVGRNVSVVGVVTASQLYGGGANITGISTSNITDYGVGLGGGGGGGVGLNVLLLMMSKFTSDSTVCCSASTSTVVTLAFLSESVTSSVVSISP